MHDSGPWVIPIKLSQKSGSYSNQFPIPNLDIHDSDSNSGSSKQWNHSGVDSDSGFGIVDDCLGLLYCQGSWSQVYIFGKRFQWKSRIVCNFKPCTQCWWTSNSQPLLWRQQRLLFFSVTLSHLSAYYSSPSLHCLPFYIHGNGFRFNSALATNW